MNDRAIDMIRNIQCEDELTLQKFLDQELEPAATELVFHHLESCNRCARTLSALKQLKSFCTEKLGCEDEMESDFSYQILNKAKARIDHEIGARRATPAARRWWRRTALVAAIIVAIATAIAWPLIERSQSVSADAILAETILRERSWAHQPNKVLHWIVETEMINQRTIPDGRYRTLCWQNNFEGQSGYISRRYDQENRLISAYWRKPDGSEIQFIDQNGGLIEIAPATARLRQALPTLDLDLRQALEDYLSRRRAESISPQAKSKSFADWFLRSRNAGTVQLINTSRWGEVFYIRTEQSYQPSASGIVRIIAEHEIVAKTFKRLRVKTTRYRLDGSQAVDDARWTYLEDATVADFDANNLDELIARTKNKVQLSPEMIARKALLENRSRLQPEKR